MTFNYQEYNAEIINGLGRVYYVPNGPYPSITTLLGHTSPPEKNNVLEAWRARVGHSKAEKITNDAAQRGTNVHLMLERALNGEDPKLDEFPKEHVSIFNSLKLEIKKINKVYGQEVVLFSDVLGIAGRCDLVAEYQNEIAIVDYKTSTRAKSVDEIGDYFIQAAFYAIAHNEMFGTNITKLVIMMGVENKMPRIFKKTLDEELLTKLATKVSNFYSKL